MITKKQINKFFNKELRTLIFFVTTKCPLRCKHCFYANELNKNLDELNLDEIKKIISKLPYLETIQLSGGEPFMRGDIVEIIKIFADNGVKKVGIPTNGYFTNQIISKVKEIKKLKIDLSISISIDGFRDLHNEIRRRDCWDNAMQTFKELKKLGIKIGFDVALSKLNYSSIIELIKFLRKQKPRNITIIIVRAKPNIMLSAEEFKKIRPEVEKLTFEYYNPFYQKRQKLLNDVYYKVLNGEKLPFKCLAGKIIAVLEPDGFVRSCELRKKLGNVRNYNYDINEILKLDKIPKNCTCIHSCFLSPSMSYSLKWIAKNMRFQFV